MSDYIKLFKSSYLKSRSDKTIYKCFNLAFREDVSDLFVHDNNEGYPPRTYMSQAICEAVIFFCENIIAENKYITDIKFDDNCYDLKIIIPNDWQENNIISPLISFYRTSFNYKNNDIILSVYNKDSSFILPDYDSPVYEFLPLFVTILAFDYKDNIEIKKLVNNYLESLDVKSFVILAETFYQTHKHTTYKVNDDMDLGII